MKQPRVRLLVAVCLGLCGCERAVVSAVNEGGALVDPPAVKAGAWLDSPGYAELQVNVMKGFDSLFSAFSGVVCLTVTSSGARANECVLSSHGVLLGLDGKPPFSAVVLPVVDPQAPLDVTVVVKRVPSVATQDVSVGLKAAVSGLEVAPVVGDGAKLLKAVLDGLAPGELPAYSHSLQLRPVDQCAATNCAGPLFDGARYALTFATLGPQQLRAQVVVRQGELVEREGAPVRFPAVLLGVRATRFNAGVFSSACRDSIAGAQLGDGKTVDPSCLKAPLLPADARALAEVVRVLDALRGPEHTTEVEAQRVLEVRRAIALGWMPPHGLLRTTLERLVGDVQRRDPVAVPLAELTAKVAPELKRVTAEARLATSCEPYPAHQQTLDTLKAQAAAALPTACGAKGCESPGLTAAFEGAAGAVDAEAGRCFLERFAALKRANPTLVLGDFDASGQAHFELDLDHLVDGERWAKSAQAFEGLALPAGPTVARMAKSWRGEQQLHALISAGLSDQGAMFSAMVDLLLQRATVQLGEFPEAIAAHYQADVERLRGSAASRLFQLRDGRLVPRQVRAQTLAELKGLQAALDAERARLVGVPVAGPN